MPRYLAAPRSWGTSRLGLEFIDVKSFYFLPPQIPINIFEKITVCQQLCDISITPLLASRSFSRLAPGLEAPTLVMDGPFDAGAFRQNEGK